MAKDVVWGMNVDEKTTKFKTERNGKTYYFCSAAPEQVPEGPELQISGIGARTREPCHIALKKY